MKIIIKTIVLLLVAGSIQSCSLLGAAGISSQGQPTKRVEGKLVSTTANSSVNVDHTIWDNLLRKYVNNEGLVDYEGFKKDFETLEDYLKILATQEPNDDWSVQELLAYYINSYNAYTVKLIVENYPVNSIKDIDGPWTKPYVPIDGREITLATIENGVLRKMNEPRIHFAIACASISCPPLLNEAYTAGKINEQLERVTRDFINNEKFNEISATNPKVSMIFKWYEKDYTVNDKKDVIGFINKYADTKINANATLQYQNYNWDLNEQK